MSEPIAADGSISQETKSKELGVMESLLFTASIAASTDPF